MRIKCAELHENGPPPPRLTMKSADCAQDCNSNTSLTDSQLSVHDPHADNSDYLWFLDYNPLFRDGSCHHTSVLSSLSASYKGIGELASRLDFPTAYDDLARDMDANLAEADMESFRTQDIHALLMTDLDERVRENTKRGEMLTSVSSSVWEKFRFDSSLSLISGQDDESTAASLNTMSICKSELLFSPVKEAQAHGVHFSVDSLDCELPSERELILTCRANKDNYTIAFEGSLTAYDEEQDNVNHCTTDNITDNNEEIDERTRRNLELLEKCHKITNKLASSMARSEQGLITWSKLRKQTGASPLNRHGSSNNNEDSSESCAADVVGSVIKSQSLPNLFRVRKLASSLHSNAMSNSTIDSFTHATNQRLPGAGACMKVYDVAHNAISRSNNSQHSEPMSTSSTENQSSSEKSQPKQPFNLVKLFMKQKKYE